MTMASTTVEDVLRKCAPHVLAVMVRRHRDFQRCEDAVQEALLAASITWPRDGIPTNPQGWLSTAATRRLIDSVRADQSRRHREQRDALLAGTAAHHDHALDEDTGAFPQAQQAFLQAARHTLAIPERNHYIGRAARINNTDR